MKLPIRLAFALLAGMLLGSAAVAAPPAKPPLPSDSAYQLPLRLTDQHGKRWDWRSKRGQPQLVAMFYSSCQYICPLIVESGKAVERGLAPAQRERMGVLLISMDPTRDTPAALMKVVRERRIDDRRWSLASPEPDAVRGVAGVLDVRYRQLADGEFNHTSALILLDADGRIVARTEKIGSNVDPDFIAAVRKLL
jgi:protein SCO1/2